MDPDKTAQSQSTAKQVENPDIRRPEVSYRHPVLEDGAMMWEMVQAIGTLELNTAYAYLLFAESFSETSLIADVEGSAVGFVLGFRLPEKPDNLFVWQVGVHPDFRGQGLARQMLDALCAMPANQDVHYLEASVTATNVPSRKLFESFARQRNVSCEVNPWLTREHFPGGNNPPHEPEDRFRIGPF